jgi:hypothetical protein
MRLCLYWVTRTEAAPLIPQLHQLDSPALTTIIWHCNTHVADTVALMSIPRNATECLLLHIPVVPGSNIGLMTGCPDAIFVFLCLFWKMLLR